MSVFTPEEIEYLRGQRLGRLAIARNGRVAFVVDDLLPPWRTRGIEARGRAEVFGAGSRQVNADFDRELIRITPTKIVAWGIDTDAFRPNSRSVGASEGTSAA